MIKHIDTVKQLSDMSADLNCSITKAKDKFNNSAQLYRERNLSQVYEAMTHVAYRLDTFCKKKQKESFNDMQLSQLIMD